MFTLSFVAPNGANTQYHTIKRVEASLPADSLTAHVQSFTSQDALLAGGAPSWSQPIDVPLTAIVAPFADSLESWMTTNHASPFLGGSILAVADADLASLKVRKWAVLKGARDVEISTGFEWSGSRFDSDLQSQIFIIGASQLATLAQVTNQPFAIDFTLQDNTIRTLSTVEMIGVGQAMGIHIMTVHAKGRALRDTVSSATDADAVSALQWVDSGQT